MRAAHCEAYAITARGLSPHWASPEWWWRSPFYPLGVSRPRLPVRPRATGPVTSGAVGVALLTDLYELNMAASYLRRGMTAPATFSLFVRDLPSQRGFVVAAGIEACLDSLEELRFTDDDLAYLRDRLGFRDQDIDAFRQLRFSGEAWAVPEGRVVFAGEPLLEVTAPIAEAQLAETILLNHITLEATLASKAARYRIAAKGRELVDFAFRRTHGVDAGMAVARVTAMCGFTATSNVEAARRYDLAVAGTMAHSYIEAFRSEADAFRAFAEDFPGRVTFLVDTYDTIRGVRTAVATIEAMGLSAPLGVRLDSGDLGALAGQARRVLDEAGMGHVRIFVSGGLDDLDVEALVDGGAPIDAFGIGTHLGVSADAPYLDTVYKMVEYDGRPVAKLSADKASSPGKKQVFRGPDLQGDLIALRDDPAPDGFGPMLHPVMRDGRRTGQRDSLDEARSRFDADLAALPEGPRRLAQPESPAIEKSGRLLELTRRIAEDVRGDMSTQSI